MGDIIILLNHNCGVLLLFQTKNKYNNNLQQNITRLRDIPSEVTFN